MLKRNVGYYFGITPAGYARAAGAKDISYEKGFFYMAYNAFAEKGKQKIRDLPPDTKSHGILWRGYDDDKKLYCWGYMAGGKDLSEPVLEPGSPEADDLSSWGDDITPEWLASSLYDGLAGGYGVCLVKLYDRKTGRYIDAIG